MTDLLTRYLAKVDRRGPTECWPWTASTNGAYGKIYSGERTAHGHPQAALAHRVGYELFVGQIPPGLVVCHSCDNPLCQNPAHWFLGTLRDNNEDKIMKGRARYSRVSRNRGDGNPNARLNEEQVREIRARYTGARGEQTVLAREYGVTQPLISMIVNQKVRT